MKNIGTFILFFLLLQPYCVLATDKTASQPEITPEDVQGNDIPVLTKSQQETFDYYHYVASDWLLNAANWFDSFFDDQRSLAEENKTRARLSLTTGYSRTNDFEMKTRVNLLLRLTKLEKRLFLFFNATDEDSDDNIDTNPILDTDAFREDDRGNDLTAGIRKIFTDSEKYGFSGNLGVSFNYAYAGVRYRYLADYNDWQMRFTNRLRYYTDIEWENISSIDFETQIGDTLFFRSTTSVALRDSEFGIPHGQYFSLRQAISKYQALAYESGIYLDTEPEYGVTDVQFRVKYRQRLYRDWLVLEVSPYITFPEEDDYEANPGFLIKFEASFGYTTDKEVYNRIFGSGS